MDYYITHSQQCYINHPCWPKQTGYMTEYRSNFVGYNSTYNKILYEQTMVLYISTSTQLKPLPHRLKHCYRTLNSPVNPEPSQTTLLIPRSHLYNFLRECRATTKSHRAYRSRTAVCLWFAQVVGVSCVIRTGSMSVQVFQMLKISIQLSHGSHWSHGGRTAVAQ